MRGVLVFILLFYFLTYFLSFISKPKLLYIWYDKMPKHKTYSFHDFLSDSPRILADIKDLSPLFLILKLFIYLIWPFIKSMQIFCMIITFIVISFCVLKLILFGGVIELPHWFVKTRYKKTIGDFLILLSIRNPVCSIFGLWYTMLRNFFLNQKSSINLWIRLYNFLISKIMGFSLWTIYTIDMLTISIYNSFKDPELCKGFHLIPQIIGENLYMDYTKHISNVSLKVGFLRIIKTSVWKFNPFNTIAKKFMFSGIEKMAQHNIKNTVLKSQNGKIHAATQESINSNLSLGSIATHTPLKGQEYIKVPSKTSKEKPQFYTLNTGYTTNMTIKDSNSLIKRSGLEKIGINIHAFDQIHYALNPKSMHIQTQEGVLMVDPFNVGSKERKLSPKSIFRNTSLDKAFRTADPINGFQSRLHQLSEIPQENISEIKRIFSEKSRNIHYDHFEENDYTEENFFEKILRKEGIIKKNIISFPKKSGNSDDEN